jgi:LacI family transcriptional regulator
MIYVKVHIRGKKEDAVLSHQKVAIVIPLSRGYAQDVMRSVSLFARTVKRWLLHLEDPTHNPELVGLKEWGPDGVLGFLSPPRVAEAVLRLGKPVVNISGRAEMSIPSVTIDDVAVGRVAADYFLARGFRRFAFLGNPFPYTRRRGQGFSERVSEAGFSCTDHILPFDSWDVPGPGWLEAEAHMRDWLISLPKPVAVLAANDQLGKDATHTCFNAGLRVPDEVALLGVDNDETICNLSTPPLSSIRTNRERLGQVAAALLDRLMSGDRRAAEEHILIPPLGVNTRQSSDYIADDDPELAEALRLLREKIEEPLSVERLLGLLPMSRRKLERRFRAALGRTPLEEIHRLKIERAKELLTLSDLSQSEIASRLGFSSADRLRLVFRKLTGISPSEYRDRYTHRA